MLRTFEQTRDFSAAQRIVGILTFTLLTALAARATVLIGDVPLTLQTLAVFGAGLVLGARDGAISQMTYVGLIMLGAPLDALGLGTAVFAAPTWGYLVGFIPCAYVTGWIAQRADGRIWQRVLAGLVGSICVFALGMLVLKFNRGLTWDAAFVSGILNFMPENLAKALIAGGLAEGARTTLTRLLNPTIE